MHILAILLAISLIADDSLKSISAKALDDLQGEWSAVSFETCGNAASTAKSRWKAIVKDNKVSVKFGVVSVRGTLVITPGGAHRTLDLTKTTWDGQDGLLEGQCDVAGIYELKDGKLTVCYRWRLTAKRPSEFKTTLDRETMMQVFERAK